MKFSINKLLITLNEILVMCGIATLVTLLWQALELVILKEIVPNDVDTIIAIILSVSLYGNYKFLEARSKLISE